MAYVERCYILRWYILMPTLTLLYVYTTVLAYIRYIIICVSLHYSNILREKKYIYMKNTVIISINCAREILVNTVNRWFM